MPGWTLMLLIAGDKPACVGGCVQNNPVELFCVHISHLVKKIPAGCEWLAQDGLSQIINIVSPSLNLISECNILNNNDKKSFPRN
ncbi:MAG: hypothetical protein WBO55_01405 [Rhizobiaceae bacterium]